MWEFFYRQNDSDSPDIKSEYINKTTKKSSWTPKEGSNRLLDQNIQEVKNDVIKNLKQDFKINITKQENKAIATYNVSIV